MVDQTPDAPDKADDAPAPGNARRPGSPVDRIIAIMLLVLAGFTVFGSLGDYLNFPLTLNAVLAELHTQMPTFPEMTYTDAGLARPMGMVIITLEGLNLGLIIWWTIRRISAGKFAFWVPLVGYAVSSLVVGTGIMVCLLSDPAVVSALTQAAQTATTVAPTTPPVSPNAFG